MSASKPTRRITIADIARMHEEGQRFATITAYDYPTARIVDEAGIPLILVGDSLGMVMLGYDTTVRVSIDEMLHHTRAVARGARHALVVGDMPFLSYGVSEGESVEHAGRFLSEAYAQAVKVEGGVRMARTIEAIVSAGIPVMGHIGLTPQAVNQLGGFRVQGRTRESARRLIADALAVQEAGAFAVVLELVPAAAGARHHRAPFHPHHRHRRRAAHLGRDPGRHRRGGPDAGLHATARASLRRGRPGSRRSRGGLP